MRVSDIFRPISIMMRPAHAPAAWRRSLQAVLLVKCQRSPGYLCKTSFALELTFAKRSCNRGERCDVPRSGQPITRSKMAKANLVGLIVAANAHGTAVILMAVASTIAVTFSRD
jgi:hypothetical protein